MTSAGVRLLVPPEPGAEPRRRPGRLALTRLTTVVAVTALPLLKPAGPGNTGLVDVGLALAVLATVLWLSGRGHVMRMPYVVPVGLFLLAGALAATTWRGLTGVADGVGVLPLVQDVFVLMWAVAVANLGRDPDLLRTFTRGWAVSASLWAALMVLGVLLHIPILSGQTAREGVRASFTLGDPNLAANFFVCSLFVLRAARYPRRRVLRWICCLLMVVAVALTGSNGGALALVLGTVLGALFGLARRRGAATAMLLAAVLAVVVLGVGPQLDTQVIAQKAQTSVPLLRDSIGRQAESTGSRSSLTTELMRLYLDSDTPLGLGPARTKEALQARQSSYVKEAHDDYTAALVERGVVGAAALVLLIVVLAVRCRRIAAVPLKPPYPAVVPRPELLGAAVVAMLLSGFFYEVMHYRHVWALFGLVAALDLWARPEPDEVRR